MQSDRFVKIRLMSTNSRPVDRTLIFVMILFVVFFLLTYLIPPFWDGWERLICRIALLATTTILVYYRS